MANDPISDRLRKLEQQRVELAHELHESAEVLQFLEDKIDLTLARQQERMRKDTRVGSEIVEALQSPTEPKDGQKEPPEPGR